MTAHHSPSPSGDPRHRLLEPPSSLRVVTEHVEAGAGRRKQHDAFRPRDPVRHVDCLVERRRLVSEEISGDAAYEHIRYMSQFHRPRGGSDGLMTVARYLEQQAQLAGLEDVRLIKQASTTKPWNARRNFILSTTGFLRYQQICSVRENQRFFDNLAKPAIKK